MDEARNENENEDVVALSMEDLPTVIQSFKIIGTIGEFYEHMRQRAEKHTPIFLKRCLDYKIKIKPKTRMQITVSWNVDTQIVLPLHISLVKKDDKIKDLEEGSTVYRTKGIYVLRNCSEINGNKQVKANFTLPGIVKLASKDKSESLAILFFTLALNRDSSYSPMIFDPSFDGPRDFYGWCGKITLKPLYDNWRNSEDFKVQQGAITNLPLEVLPCRFQIQEKGQSILIQNSITFYENLGILAKKLQVSIFAEEFVANESSGSSQPSSSLINGLKGRNILFNYWFNNKKFRITEGRNNFECPICLMKCGSYEGIQCHLVSSHDFYNYKFEESEDCHVVTITPKHNSWNVKIIAEGVDPRVQNFMLMRKWRKRMYEMVKSSENENGTGNEQNQQVLELVIANNGNEENLQNIESEIPKENKDGYDSDLQIIEPDEFHRESENRDEEEIQMLEYEPVDGNEAEQQMLELEVPTENSIEILEHFEGVSNAIVEYVPEIPEFENATPEQVELIANQLREFQLSDFTKEQIGYLDKRQFYHSSNHQPLSMEEILMGDDSETEEDDEVEEIETRIRINRLPNLTKEQKELFVMWNTFIYQQKVVAFSHIPWACVSFTRVHVHKFAQSFELALAWRLQMINLWNQELIDGKTMNACNDIIEEFKKQNSDGPSG